MARITVKVHPRARRTRIAGMLGDKYKLELAAPPVDGKANEALIALVATHFGLRRAQVTLKRGASSRLKTLELAE